MIRTFLTAAGLLICLPGLAPAAETPVLHVYTYDSFASEWGPGPAIEAAFEETCGCDVQFTTTGDGAALLARLRLEGARSAADVVVGLDTALSAQAEATGLFKPHGRTVLTSIPNPNGEDGTWDDPFFVPFDWGYFAFVYDKTKLANPPRSFRELAAAPKDLKIIIEDPRSSTPGLGLLLWIEAAYGSKAGEIWDGLVPHVLTVTKGWSEAYGLFLNGEADMVLSYTTSPAYHLIAEQDDSKAAAIFSEGHYMQIEVAGIIAHTKQPDLAEAFLDFLLSDRVQALIPTTNWMYPALMPEGGLPEGFAVAIPADKALLLDPARALGIRGKALDTWLAAFSR